MPENNGERRTAGNDPVDRAVEASKRLEDAASKVGDAYADAYQETSKTIAGAANLRGTGAGATPEAWSRLMFDSLAGKNPLGDKWPQASKQLGRAYIEVLERSTIATIEMRERLAAASNADWIRSMAQTRSRLERDAASSFFSAARGFLG
jgi:hypothetical protein